MKKIVHFGKYYHPDAGGIEGVTLTLAQGAVRHGYAVGVVCFAHHTPPGRETHEGVRVVRCATQRLVASQPLGLGYFFACLAAARRADLIHLHVPNMLAALCALLVGRRKRLLVHWHSDLVDKKLLGRLLRPLEAALLRRADVIVATSRVYADASKALAPFLNKVSVAALGVEEPGPLPAAEGGSALAADLRLAIGGRRVVLGVGRLVPYKGFDVLIAAAEYLADDAVVVIVGDGPLREQLATAVATTGHPDRIILAGRQSDRALAELFATSTLFCLPSISRAEAFGLVLLQAMAHSLPIVAADIPGSGPPWVNQHGLSGLNVPVGDARALAAACNEILGSAAVHARYAAGARRRFLAEFTAEGSVARMLELYRHLLDSR